MATSAPSRKSASSTRSPANASARLRPRPCANCATRLEFIISKASSTPPKRKRPKQNRATGLGALECGDLSPLSCWPTCRPARARPAPAFLREGCRRIVNGPTKRTSTQNRYENPNLHQFNHPPLAVRGVRRHENRGHRRHQEARRTVQL